MRLLISALLLGLFSSPASALTASQSTDGGVTIRANVATGAVVDPGDRISFQYQPARDGALIVFDIDTQGYVSLLTDEPVEIQAREGGQIPDDRSEFFAEGEPGVEFVFAVAVADRDAIDSDALASLRDETRRINGDPFVAANMIAAELVSSISQHSVFMGYTYFYVSERVEYPCYLCGACDGTPAANNCDGYRIVQNFDRGLALAYPLARGYDMVEVAGSGGTVTETPPDDVAFPPADDDVNVNFYPYGSEVHYADPVALDLWYTWGVYDPYYWYYPYCYPYYYSPWFSIGFGWGWGYGHGGYYCSGWYDPWYGCGYYPNSPSAYPGSVTKFKSRYKSGSAAPTLSQNRAVAMKKDGDLRVATKGVRSSAAKTSFRSKSAVGGNPFTTTGGHRVKTSVSGPRSLTRETWAKGRSGSTYKGNSPYRSGRSSMYQPKGASGKTIMERGGYKRGGNGAVQPQRGTRVKSGSTYAPRGSATRSKSSWSAPSTRSAPRSGGTSSAPRVGSYKGSYSSPSFRGGGGWSGGGRSMGSAGGGMRGGGMKGGGGRGR